MKTPEIPAPYQDSLKSDNGNGAPASGEFIPSDSIVPAAADDRALARYSNDQLPVPSVGPEDLADIDDLGAEAIQTIEDRDTPDARGELALGYSAQLAGEIQEFTASQNALGGAHHINGIKRTGWVPWGRFFKIASYVLMGVDALLWFVCGSRALVKTFWIFLLLIAIGFAFAGKWVGTWLATVRYVDPTSGKQTIAGHIQALKKIILPIIGVAVLALLMAFAPLTLAPVIIAIGWIPLITLNALIGYTAGVCSSVGDILLKPEKHDELEYEIQRRIRLREILRKYFPRKPPTPRATAVIVLALGLVFAGSAVKADTPDACGIFVDETRSLDPADRQHVVDFILASIFEYLFSARCEWAVVGKFGGDGRFEQRNWIRVPPSADGIDCEKAEPEPLTGHAGLLDHIRSVAEYRKGEAVDACRRKREAFLVKAREALAVVPRPGPTRLTPFLRDLMASGLYRSIVVGTDGIDTPSVPMAGLSNPKNVAVTLVIVRPDPAYGKPEQALTHVRQWNQVPGVQVVTSSELRPQIWAHSAGGER